MLFLKLIFLSNILTYRIVNTLEKSSAKQMEVNDVEDNKSNGIDWSVIISETIVKKVEEILFGKEIQNTENKEDFKRASNIVIAVSEFLKLYKILIYDKYFFHKVIISDLKIENFNRSNIASEFDVSNNEEQVPKYAKRVGNVPYQCYKGSKRDRTGACRPKM